MSDQSPVKVMETRCLQCHSRFRITQQQLKAANGIVRCSSCNSVFNALSSLKSSPRTANSSAQPATPAEELSLHQAMYGDERSSFALFTPMLWIIGILLLISLALVQAVYYQRYALIEKPQFQQQVANLCAFLPCNELQFSSTQQIKLMERNVYTHPVRSNALMITGSFVNQAPFQQKLPQLLVSLFDIQGNLIANRVFSPAEYLQSDKNRSLMPSTKPVQFRLEVIDPGTTALTYEFEFI